MKDVKFQVLWKDRITAEVEIKDNKAHIKKYDPNPIRHLFPWENTDAYHVAEIPRRPLLATQTGIILMTFSTPAA